MKKALFTFLTTIFFAATFGQTGDSPTVRTLNSKLISDEPVDDFELLTKYYAIGDNISNKNSTAYVSDTPAVAEYAQFAINQPSYFFVIHKGASVKLEVTLLQKKENDVTTFSYLIVNPGTGRKLEVPSRVPGQITQGRVQELERTHLDRSSKIIDLTNGKAYAFNGTTYSIQSFAQVKTELLGLVRPILTGMASAKDGTAKQ